MAGQNKNLKQPVKKSLPEAVDFAVRKFLLRAEVIEKKQELLGKKIDELLKNIKLKRVYQKIVSQD